MSNKPSDNGTAMSLNDPQWGRGGGSRDGSRNADGRDGNRDNDRRPQRPQGDGPPDLDELWRDFNRRLNSLFGRKGGGRGGDGGGGMGSFRPDARGAGLGVLAIIAAAVLIWFGSGFYIVPEGQVGVVTTFGRFSETTPPGFRWRMPWPVQAHEVVDVLSVRTVEVGGRGRADRLKEALMLTDDENIVDLHFTVQYRIKEGPDGARDFVFNSQRPTEAVPQTAESAMREVVGGRAMDAVLFESRQQIADDVRRRMQAMLDRYGTGLLVLEVAIQNAQPPEQVQAAFDDAVKAGQDRERLINEGQAYANDVVPRARGLAARLTQEAEGYRTRVTENAQGDAARFRQVLAEYEKAPQVTRDRMYIETMQQVFTNSTKVMVDARGGNNVLFLPFDRLVQQAIAECAAAPRGATPATPQDLQPTTPSDSRTRDSQRTREREGR
jgi:membrane protease subunit HflK